MSRRPYRKQLRLLLLGGAVGDAVPQEYTQALRIYRSLVRTRPNNAKNIAGAILAREAGVSWSRGKQLIQELGA